MAILSLPPVHEFSHIIPAWKEPSASDPGKIVWLKQVVDICLDAGFHLGDIGNTLVHHLIDVVDNTAVDGCFDISSLGIQWNISETCRSVDAHSVLNFMYLHIFLFKPPREMEMDVHGLWTVIKQQQWR